jgi:hypothetical protein
MGRPLPLAAVFWGDVLHDAAWLLALSGLTPLLPPRARKHSAAALVPLAAGLGLLFLYDALLFSQAAPVHRGLLYPWQARGFIDTLAVPLLAIAAQRNPS